MSDPDCKDPRRGGDPFAVLRIALEMLRRVQAARSRCDRLAEELEDFLQSQLENPNTFLEHPGSGRPAPFLVRRLRITRNPDDSGMIEIDDEKPFRLPPDLTDLLEHLASDNAVSDDALVPWKSRDSLSKWFEQRKGRAMRARYVNKRVSDLRRQLRKAGIKRYVVHTHAQKGVRFALRRYLSS